MYVRLLEFSHISEVLLSFFNPFFLSLCFSLNLSIPVFSSLLVFICYAVIPSSKMVFCTFRSDIQFIPCFASFLNVFLFSLNYMNIFVIFTVAVLRSLSFLDLFVLTDFLPDKRSKFPVPLHVDNFFYKNLDILDVTFLRVWIVFCPFKEVLNFFFQTNSGNPADPFKLYVQARPTLK